MRRHSVIAHVEGPKRHLKETMPEELRRFDHIKVRQLRLDGDLALCVVDVNDDGSIEIMIDRITLTPAQVEELRSDIDEILTYGELFKD